MKKVLSIIMAALLVCTLFAGCQPKKQELPEGAISPDIYRAALVQSDMFFQQSYGISLVDMLEQDLGDGTTGADMLREQALSLIKEFESVRLFAIDNGITLGDEDLKELEAAKKEQYDAAGSKEEFIKSITENGLNEAYFDYVMEAQIYYGKVAELFAEGGKYAPDIEGVKAQLKSGYARVKHVLIQSTEDSEDYEEKKALAEDIAKRAAAGEDFDALIKEYGEDPGMESSADGYLLDAEGFTPEGGQMITEFTTASHALADNGVSAVVPSSYGFHIIKRYPIDDAFIDSYITNNKETFEYNALTTEISKYIEKVEITNLEELEAIDIHEAVPHSHDAEAPEATAEAVPEATADAAPEATTEAAPEATTDAAPEATVELTPLDDSNAATTENAGGIEQGVAVPAA